MFEAEVLMEVEATVDMVML